MLSIFLRNFLIFCTCVYHIDFYTICIFWHVDKICRVKKFYVVVFCVICVFFSTITFNFVHVCDLLNVIHLLKNIAYTYVSTGFFIKIWIFYSKLLKFYTYLLYQYSITYISRQNLYAKYLIR